MPKCTTESHQLVHLVQWSILDSDKNRHWDLSLMLHMLKIHSLQPPYIQLAHIQFLLYSRSNLITWFKPVISTPRDACLKVSGGNTEHQSSLLGDSEPSVQSHVSCWLQNHNQKSKLLIGGTIFKNVRVFYFICVSPYYKQTKWLY